MAIKLYKEILDIKQDNQLRLRVKQNDNITLRLNIVMDGEEVNLTDMLVRLNVQTPAGKNYFQQDAEGVKIINATQGVVEIPVLSKCFETAGHAVADLTITDKAGLIFATTTFSIIVDKAVYSIDGVKNDTNKDAIEKILSASDTLDKLDQMAKKLEGYDLDKKADKKYVDDTFATKEEIKNVKVDLTGYAKETYVDDKVSKIDLTPYAKAVDVNTKVKALEDKAQTISDEALATHNLINHNIEELDKKKIENLQVKNFEKFVGNFKGVNFTDGLQIEVNKNDSTVVNVGIPISSKTAPLENLRGEALINGTSLNISWSNPSSTDFTKAQVFISTDNISGFTYNDLLTNTTKNITMVADGKINTATYTSINGKTYYVVGYAIYSINNVVYQSQPVNNIVKAVDNVKASTVDNFTAVRNGKDSVRLSWKNPVSDERFSYVVIKSMIDNYPADENEGQLVYQGSAESYVDTALITGKEYYYKIFTVSKSGIYSSNISCQKAVELSMLKPQPMTTATADPQFNSIRLSWVDNIASFKTVIVRKKGTVGSASLADGDTILILEKNDFGKYNSAYFEDKTLTDNTTYTYSFFSISEYDVPSDAYSISSKTLEINIPNVKDLNIISKDNASIASVEFNFEEIPTALTYSKSVGFYVVGTAELLPSLSYDGCLNSPYVKKFIDEKLTTTAKTSKDITGLKHNDYIQVKIFNIFTKADNSEVKSTGTYANITIVDTTLPTDIKQFSTESADTKITIKWENSNDADFGKVEIFRSENSDMSSAVKDYSDTSQKVGTINTFEASPLSPNKTYYFQLITTDSRGNQNVKSFNVKTLSADTLGVEFNVNTGSCKRIEGAEGKTQSQIADHAIFKAFERCVVDNNGNIVYYLDPTNSANKIDGTPAILDGTDGNIMVKIPKLYYKVSDMGDGQTYQFSISLTKYAGYEVHPMFITGGVEKNVAFLGAFESSRGLDGKLQSISSILPNSSSVDILRSSAKAIGTGWKLFSRHCLDFIRMCYIIKYANFDSQAKCGLGVVNDTALHKTGETLHLGNKDSDLINMLNDGKHQCSVFGLEGLWGNNHDLVDSVIITDSNFYITDGDSSDFTSPTATGSYTKVVGYNPKAGSGWVQSLKLNKNFKTMFFSGNVDENTVGFVGDYFYNKGQETYANQFIGGMYDGGTKCGIFSTFYKNAYMDKQSRVFQPSATNGLYEIDYTKNQVINDIQKIVDVSIDESTVIPTLIEQFQVQNMNSRLFYLGN